MLARLMYGGQVSLFIGILRLWPLFFGVIYGSVSGFLGGATDQAMMRFADFVVALPFLLFMILFKVIFGIGPGDGIWPMLVRSFYCGQRPLVWCGARFGAEGCVRASRLLGGTTAYVVGRHIFPQHHGRDIGHHHLSGT